MKHAQSCFLCLTALMVSGMARAGSDYTEVTPATLGKHQLVVAVSVTHAAYRDTFRVSVRPRPGVPYHFVMGNASAWFEDVHEGRNHISLPETAAAPIKIIGHGKQDTDFHFTVPHRETARLCFYFGYAGYDTGQRIMPSGDFYWFNLSTFTPPAAPGRGNLHRRHRRSMN